MKDISLGRKLIIRIILLATGATLILAGLSNGGFKDVKTKATKICYECMGIG